MKNPKEILEHINEQRKWYFDEIEKMEKKLKLGDWDDDDHDRLESFESVYHELTSIIEFIES
jgi:hypothetical protein